MTALLLGFPALMAYAAASDLLTMTIPNRISLALIAAFFALAIWLGLPLAEIGLHVGAALAVLCVTFTLFAFGWIGGGDAKLAAATALWFGFGALPEYLVLASALGGGLTLLILVLRSWPMPIIAMGWPWLSRLREPQNGVPYGIALAAAALVVYPHSILWTTAVGG